MDYAIFNVLGYKTNKLLNECASKIQKSYRNYRSYQIKKRIDYIYNVGRQNNDENNYLNEIINEELEYWNNMRYKIKNCGKIKPKSISEEWSYI